MLIKFYVEEQSVQLKTNKCIASDTINFVELNFTFCDCWAEYDKTIQFTQQTNTYSINLGTEGTNCYLPSEITDGLCSISVFGTNDGKRITTVPCQIRIKRSGFIEGGIIPEDAQLTVIEQVIEQSKKNTEDIEEIKGDIKEIEGDITDIKQSLVNVGNPNNLADVFDLMFGGGYTQDGITVTYDKTINELTISGEATEEVKFGHLNVNSSVYLDMGYYEFCNIYNANYFEAEGSELPFHLALTPFARGAMGLYPIADYYEIKHRTQAGTRGDNMPDYNTVDRDIRAALRLVIPAGSSFNNNKYYPCLYRYSCYILES